MSNSIGLIEDSVTLATRASFGRAQALVNVAARELAGARFLFAAAESEWSTSLIGRRVDGEALHAVEVPDELHGQDHSGWPSSNVARLFANGLGNFWDLYQYGRHESGDQEFVARDQEIKIHAGMYVDRAGNIVASPRRISEGDLRAIITMVARAIELHLLDDVARQKAAPYGAPVFSVRDLYVGIFPYAHPEVPEDLVDQLARQLQPVQDST